MIVVSCGGAPGTPTSPSAVTSASNGHGRLDGSEATSSANTLHELLLTKTCDALDHCTVITATSGPIPVGSEVNYLGPLLEARTTSRILVTTPDGDTATGHCSVSYRTGEGTCVLTGGTGALAELKANLRVSSDFTLDPAGVFTWDGHYHFTR